VASLGNVIPIFERTLDKFSFHSLLLADNAELDSELRWACQRPKSLARGRTLDHECPEAFLLALTQLERNNLEKYMEIVADGHCAVSLGKNAAKDPRHSSSSVLHATALDDGLVFVSSVGTHGRWMAPSELLLAKAFPTRRLTGFACSSFDVAQDAHTRSRSAIVTQASSTMNLVAMSAVWLYTFAFVNLKPKP
jgi:hypothetical protein